MDLGQALKDSVKANVNVKGLFNDVVDKVVVAALNEAIKASPTPIDDVVAAALLPLLVKAAKDLFAQEIDKLLP